MGERRDAGQAKCIRCGEWVDLEEEVIGEIPEEWQVYPGEKDWGPAIGVHCGLLYAETDPGCVEAFDLSKEAP